MSFLCRAQFPSRRWSNGCWLQREGWTMAPGEWTVFNHTLILYSLPQGLYTEEPFDPSPEWYEPWHTVVHVCFNAPPIFPECRYFGIHNDNCGWFPGGWSQPHPLTLWALISFSAQCVASQDSKSPEPASDEVYWGCVLGLIWPCPQYTYTLCSLFQLQCTLSGTWNREWWT